MCMSRRPSEISDRGGKRQRNAVAQHVEFELAPLAGEPQQVQPALAHRERLSQTLGAVPRLDGGQDLVCKRAGWMNPLERPWS